MSSTAVVVPKPASTPTKGEAPEVTESPGNWKHPRLAEITRRQRATVFSESNVKTIMYNVAALAIVLAARLIGTKYPLLAQTIRKDIAAIYGGWVWFMLEAIPLINIAFAFTPLFRKKDEMSDIPLTPGQRKLLGLPPSAVSPTPNSAYSTPPRYSRTPSISGSAASNRSYASSPLSGKGSPVLGRRPSGSPYSPAGSPLLQKAVAGGMSGARRSSFGSPGPLAATAAASLFPDLPSTPSPSSGKRSSVGLNNKWLYERGRRSSGSGRLH